MVWSLIDEIHNKWIANQTAANQLDQAERELAEYQATNAPERNQTPLDPLKGASNFQNAGLFGTPEIPNARSGRYTGENSQRSPSQGMTHRSLSYSGLDEIDTGLQRPRSTPIQFQNGSTERQGEPRTRIPPLNHSIPKNRTPFATSTLHQAGFDNLAEQAQRHDLRAPVNIDSQREDLGIPNETGAFQNYIKRNNAELKRIHAIVHMAKSSSPDIDMVIEETRRTQFTKKIASVRLNHVGKLQSPQYAVNTNPKVHVRAFRLAISREHLTDDEKEAGSCRFFAENLTGAALEWFAGLEENSIDNFTQLVSTFLKQYSVFIETRVTEADLWNLKQAPFEPLRRT